MVVVVHEFVLRVSGKGLLGRCLHGSPQLWTHEAPVQFFVALARQFSWRAARGREAGGAAPRLGGGWILEAARGGRLFPAGVGTKAVPASPSLRESWDKKQVIG